MDPQEAERKKIITQYLAQKYGAASGVDPMVKAQEDARNQQMIAGLGQALSQGVRSAYGVQGNDPTASVYEALRRRADMGVDQAARQKQAMSEDARSVESRLLAEEDRGYERALNQQRFDADQGYRAGQLALDERKLAADERRLAAQMGQKTAPELVAIETIEDGKPVRKFVPKAEGLSYAIPPNAASQPKLTDNQYKAALFGRRIQAANDVIDTLEKGGYDRSSKKSAIAASILPGAFQSEELRSQEQAERNFVNAVLREESGAAIAESEFENAQKQYFPRAGDSPAVLAQKRQNREQALKAFEAEAAGAWDAVPLVARRSLKADPEEGVAYADEQKSDTRVINGSKYKRVKGGWALEEK